MINNKRSGKSVKKGLQDIPLDARDKIFQKSNWEFEEDFYLLRGEGVRIGTWRCHDPEYESYFLPLGRPIEIEVWCEESSVGVFEKSHCESFGLKKDTLEEMLEHYRTYVRD